MIAVLEDALEIHRKYAPRSGRSYERLVAETEEWLFSDDTAWPLSFLNICAVLGLDASWLRAQLVRPSRAPATVSFATAVGGRPPLSSAPEPRPSSFR